MKGEKASLDFDRSLVRRRNDELPREISLRSSGFQQFSSASALGRELGRLCGFLSKWCKRLLRDRTRRTSVERIPPTDTELAAIYDAAAEHWHDRLDLLGYPRAYENLFDRLLANGTLRSLRDGGRVLDCGIGTAAFSLALAGKVAAPVEIEGVDISPSMLLQACLNLDHAGIDVRPHLRDVKDLPFEDDTFEAVIGAHVLEHLLDPFAGLSEMARVLKPGGPLVIVVTSRSISDVLLRLKWRYERIEPDRLVHRMEEAGLISVRTYPLLAGGSLPHWANIACVGFKEGVSRCSDTWASKSRLTRASPSPAGGRSFGEWGAVSETSPPLTGSHVSRSSGKGSARWAEFASGRGWCARPT